MEQIIKKTFTFEFEPEEKGGKMKSKTETAVNNFSFKNLIELAKNGYTRVKGGIRFVESFWTVDGKSLHLDVLHFTPVIEGDFLKMEFNDYYSSKGEVLPASDKIIITFPD